MDRHTKSNKHFTRVWRETANDAKSRLFIALGTDARGDLQVYPVDDIDIKQVPDLLREAADRIEQGNTPNNGLIIPA